MRCFLGVPNCEKYRIQVSFVPACGINDDLFACIRSAVFPDFQVSSVRVPECSCVVLYKFEDVDPTVKDARRLIWLRSLISRECTATCSNSMECRPSDTIIYPSVRQNFKEDGNFGISNGQISLRFRDRRHS
ncbi:hypothetical protein TNCV_209601 [Trichonephila clavipes]|uniref:Uncharacterized protein n=1 Tax=Trichonephila clavipes TaxID=2585209 RepID=A0A8X6T769_TRICX|nr:hypothetical protein TNCV_209601 [Trichonephila clavipes]